MAYSQGDVVLVPFPFRDQLAERTRPAVVVSADTYNQRGDIVVAAVTSHAPRHNLDVALNDWKAAGLKFPSTVRMLLATVAESRVVLHAGRVSQGDWQSVQTSLNKVFV